MRREAAVRRPLLRSLLGRASRATPAACAAVNALAPIVRVSSPSLDARVVAPSATARANGPLPRTMTSQSTPRATASSTAPSKYDEAGAGRATTPGPARSSADPPWFHSSRPLPRTSGATARTSPLEYGPISRSTPSSHWA
jgi:hypothetical protein